MSRDCTCPDPYCPKHARCLMGHALIILPDDPAFCPVCERDVMPVGACAIPSPACLPHDDLTEQTLRDGLFVCVACGRPDGIEQPPALTDGHR